ncbi:MAG: leucine-rich repeat domain-containing protein [Phycisphaerae bacterium]|nr:leucine-rich repeat domain-containing protein [Phycisphaerae bacterium]
MTRYCVVAIVSCLTCLSVASAQTVNIPDANLRQAILETLGMPAGATITQDDMLRLETLGVFSKGVCNLSGIEYAKNLRWLWLYENEISNIGPLSELTSLTQLCLTMNQISDVTPLAGLTGLTELHLARNQVSDISPLGGMMDLRLLYLDNNRIADISSLHGKNQMEKLSLWNNGVSDISPLSGMTGVTSLWLASNQVSDISGLAGMTNLAELSLGDNPISDLTPLAELTSITSLSLRNNGLTEIGFLANLHDLLVLDLANNQEITDISVVAGMPQLQNLNLYWNHVSDLSPLMGLTNLQWTDVRSNPLGADAYQVYIPQILANNPGIELLYDPPAARTLRVSATTGGAVVKPGEGTFEYTQGTVTTIEASSTRGYQFAGWTGSAVNLGKVADPSAARTTVVVDGNYSLVANFKTAKDSWTIAYSEDSEGEIGPEWSHTTTDITPVGERQFLGQFGNDTVTLTLENLPPHSGIKVTFDLFIVRTWDGYRATTYGPDIWSLHVDGQRMICTTFDNHHLPEFDPGSPTSAHRQSYPGEYPGGNFAPQTGAKEANVLGYICGWTVPTTADAVYELESMLPHWDSSLRVDFDASGLEAMENESWGLDNVRIELTGDGEAEGPVFFRDPQLKACVEAHLGVTDPTPTDMLNLTELTCTGSGIFDLTGLEYAFNLTYLDLSGNQITDLSPLLGLTSLRVLNLAGNPLDADAYSTYLSLLRALNLGLELTHDIPLIAWSPEPVNGAVGVVSRILHWKAGRTAASHDLYFSRSSTISSRALVGRLTTTEYAISSSLLPGATYYWRVDEVEADGTTLHEGPVWSFTAADPRTLTVSALPGGSVLTPGEGQFQIEKGTILTVEAAPADAGYEFLTWSGTAVENGRVEDVNVATTRIVVDANYTLEAVFVERAAGPVLGFSAGEIEVDDPNQFYYRVATNNTPEATFVERVTGVEPDPNGMVRMQVVEGEPARTKGRFGRCSAARVLVRFEYLFETADAREIVVYLSDVPDLLDHDDPSRPEHYVEIGRVLAPPEGCPGSFGSGRFGVFEEWAFVEGLDLSNGTWVELELASGAMLAGSPKSIQGSIRLVSGDPDGSAVFDSLSVQVHCSGYCLDLNFTKTVDSQDLLLVMAACGSTAELEEGGEGSRYCLDGVFSHDGYVDAHDIYSLIWALSDLTRVDCGSLCRVPLPLVNTSGGISAGGYPAGSSVESASVGPWPTDLLILYKGTRSDRYGLFDGEGAYVSDFTMAGMPTDSAAKVVRGVADDVYVISTEEGVLEIADPVRRVIPPAKVAYNSAMVYIGIQGQGSSSFGRPILDAAFDGQGYAHVVPVVVEPEDGEAYVCAAQLEVQEGEDPPYRVVRLYDDPAPANDNRYRDCLREIEVDSAGNVYVLNVHRLNESCLLWKYGSDGTLLARLSLLAPGSPAKVADPAALHVSHDGKTLYLVSGQQDQAHPGSVLLYGLSTTDLSLVRMALIEAMPLATSITEDPATGTLWVTGFRTTEEAAAFPWLPAKFTHTALLAKVLAGVKTAEATAATDPTADGSTLPVSILWTGAVQ